MLRRFLAIGFLFTCDFGCAQHYILYSFTTLGGAHGTGMLFRYDPAIGKFDTLYSLNQVSGCVPAPMHLTLAKNGLLYSITSQGGTKDSGTLFSYDPYSRKFNVLFNFGNNGRYCCSNSNDLMQARNGLLYGTITMGGTYDSGFIFSYDISLAKYTILHNFKGGKADGWGPNTTLAEDTATGYFFGTTSFGGTHDDGVIYRFDPVTGKDTVVFSFDTLGGKAGIPRGNGLLKASDGMYYGITTYGGYMIRGTIHRFNPITYQDTTVHLFGTGGDSIIGTAWDDLMQASDGLMYAVSNASIFDNGRYIDGGLFSYNITTNKETSLVRFEIRNGRFGQGDLVQDPDNGLLYGITTYGGQYGFGVLFSYNITTGQENVLVNFNDTNGAYPESGVTLVLDTGGLGINEFEKRSYKTEIEPNPNSGKFQIEITNYKLGMNDRVQVYNMLGEKVASDLHPKGGFSTFDLSAQPNGLYLYRVVTESGELVGEAKFIIQK